LPVVRIFPECVTSPEKSKPSGRTVTFTLWTGMLSNKGDKINEIQILYFITPKNSNKFLGLFYLILSGTLLSLSIPLSLSLSPPL
jgi:hypothetical protein